MKFRTSPAEIKEIITAWLAISIAFTILRVGGFSSEFGKYFAISAIAVGLGFILHELGHKYMAQKYGYQAEFKAFNLMLVLAILMSFVGFIIAAPGAVMIRGLITRKKYGKISLAGPAMNLILATIFLALFYSNILTELTGFGALINTWIGLFNLIPFGPFDGRKILNWSRTAYATAAIVGVVLLILTGQLISF